MYVCMCIYIYVCMYTHIYIYTYVVIYTHPRASMKRLVRRFWGLVDVVFSTDLSVRGTAFACLLACLPACLPVCLPARLPACLRACLLVRSPGCLLACWRRPRMRYPCVCPRQPCNRPDVPRSFQGFACLSGSLVIKVASLLKLRRCNTVRSFEWE